MLDSIKLKILDPRVGSDVSLPAYQTSGSAGVDLYACIEEPITLEPNKCTLIPSGISVFIENPRFCGIIAPRSGLGHKKGLVLGNLVGIIDSDYQGEIKVSLWNRSESPQTIKPLERIAQLLFIPVATPSFQIVESMEETERGCGGFGSTGSGVLVD